MFPIATFKETAKTRSWHGRGGQAFLRFPQSYFNTNSYLVSCVMCALSRQCPELALVPYGHSFLSAPAFHFFFCCCFVLLSNTLPILMHARAHLPLGLLTCLLVTDPIGWGGALHPEGPLLTMGQLLIFDALLSLVLLHISCITLDSCLF